MDGVGVHWWGEPSERCCWYISTYGSRGGLMAQVGRSGGAGGCFPGGWAPASPDRWLGGCFPDRSDGCCPGWSFGRPGGASPSGPVGASPVGRVGRRLGPVGALPVGSAVSRRLVSAARPGGRSGGCLSGWFCGVPAARPDGCFCGGRSGGCFCVGRSGDLSGARVRVPLGWRVMTSPWRWARMWWQRQHSRQVLS